MTIKNSVGTQVLAIGAAGGIIMNASQKIKTTLGDSSITPYIELYSNSTGNTTIQSSTSYGLVLNPAGANVGIGTTNPGYKLDVSGSIRSKSGTTGTLYLGETSGGTTYVAAALIGTPSTTYNPTGRLSIQLPTHGVGTDYGLTEQMSIQVPAADSKAATMILLPFGGNVGIGTTSPSAKLQVKGSGATSSTTALRVENSNASSSLVVLDDGRIGVGTITPLSKLHVEGINDLLTLKMTFF
jgi:hypothetical protein